MIEINLIPDVKQELIKAERVRSIVISFSILIGLIALGIVAMLAIYVFAVQTVRSALDDEGIKTESAKLASVEDLSKTLTIQNQLNKISELNDQKKMNSRLFDAIAAVIPPAPNNIQVSTLSVNAADSMVAIEGQAAGGFAALEVFKKTIGGAVMEYTVDEEKLQTPLASDISTSDVSYGEDSTGTKVLRFTIRFKYPEELFSPKTPTFAFKLINEGNATDSYLGVPKSIFVQRADDLEGNQ